MVYLLDHMSQRPCVSVSLKVSVSLPIHLTDQKSKCFLTMAAVTLNFNHIVNLTKDIKSTS